MSFLSSDQLQNPELFSSTSPFDQEDMMNYYYVIYYNNTDCTKHVQGIKGFVSKETNLIPLLSDDISCEDAMACLYDEGGTMCQERWMNSTKYQSFSYEPRVVGFADEEELQLSSCQGTLVDLNGGGCIDASPKQCTQSAVFAQCHFRVFSATFLARNPTYLTGDYWDSRDWIDFGDWYNPEIDARGSSSRLIQSKSIAVLFVVITFGLSFLVAV